MSLHAERAKCFSSTKATPFPSQILKKGCVYFLLNAKCTLSKKSKLHNAIGS